ncbi:MAG TPA: nuclear transport factor 2 family protein, partial [Gemmatimonadales bacterium]|nr:nuclear transport factor 2 family protein [Gemmatimonadales bacterium]
MAGCSQEQRKASAAAATEALWKEYAASLNEGDLERWLSLWTEDGIQMPPDEAAIAGKDNIRARNEAMLDRFTFEIGITNQEVETAGDLAYSRGTYKARLVPKDGGRPVSIDGKYLTILERQA